MTLIDVRQLIVWHLWLDSMCVVSAPGLRHTARHYVPSHERCFCCVSLRPASVLNAQTLDIIPAVLLMVIRDFNRVCAVNSKVHFTSLSFSTVRDPVTSIPHNSHMQCALRPASTIHGLTRSCRSDYIAAVLAVRILSTFSHICNAIGWMMCTKTWWLRKINLENGTSSASNSYITEKKPHVWKMGV